MSDPYVERLIGSFSFMSAHMQRCIDDAFPHLTQPLLETVYPNNVDRMPSIAVARVCRGSVA